VLLRFDARQTILNGAASVKMKNLGKGPGEVIKVSQAWMSGEALSIKLHTYMKKRLGFYVLGTVLLLILLGAAGGATAWHWMNQPLVLPSDQMELSVEAGNSPRMIARTLNASGVPIWEPGFAWLARLSGRDKKFRAGVYKVMTGDTPWILVERLSSNDSSQMVQRQITFFEGWTFRQFRQALRENPDIKQTLGEMSDAALMAKLGSDVAQPEGMFYPNTYNFVPGSTDFDVLRRAFEEGRRVLSELWEQRQPDLPITTPYEALILASIIEKETGHGPERDRISGVFVNRLCLSMRLQTDPTVIYGMGEAYQGKIRKRDLEADTPWNTYTRIGLPPTPISAVGRASLLAALQPERHKYLYFVSRGNGTSEFSLNLNEHQNNVNQYILRKKP
jgi:UPF0755 protein